MHPDKKLKGKYFIIGFLIGAIVCSSLVAIVKNSFLQHLISGVVGAVITFGFILITPWTDNLKLYFTPTDDNSNQTTDQTLIHHSVTVKTSGDAHKLISTTEMTFSKDSLNLSFDDMNKLAKSLHPNLGNTNQPTIPPTNADA